MKLLLFLLLIILLSCEEETDCSLLREAYLQSRQEWSSLRDRYVDLDTLDDRTKELKRRWEECEGL